MRGHKNVIFLRALSTYLDSAQNPDSAVSVGALDLGGVVASARGPEAGVWVIADSPKVRAAPGRILNLNAVPAPNAAAAAEYYPPIYWYSMLRIPEQNLFPGTGPQGNGIPVTLKTQGEWLNVVKTNGCMSCHALGTKATRTICNPGLSSFGRGPS